jgi:hypothetical protein
MSDINSNPERMSDRYATLAAKSANDAIAAANRCQMGADSEEPRDAKRARREAKEWAEQCTLDAARAHGALAAETGQFEAQHARAAEAQKTAEQARDRAAQIYRELKGGSSDND